MQLCLMVNEAAGSASSMDLCAYAVHERRKMRMLCCIQCRLGCMFCNKGRTCTVPVKLEQF